MSNLPAFGLQAKEKPLLGATCSVPKISGHGRWWVSVVDQSPCGKFVRVSGHSAFGKARWFAVSDVSNIRQK